jgi:hypothetical protein
MFAGDSPRAIHPAFLERRAELLTHLGLRLAFVDAPKSRF